jgi:hypothetical protein
MKIFTLRVDNHRFRLKVAKLLESGCKPWNNRRRSIFLCRPPIQIKASVLAARRSSQDEVGLGRRRVLNATHASTPQVEFDRVSKDRLLALLGDSFRIFER